MVFPLPIDKVLSIAFREVSYESRVVAIGKVGHDVYVGTNSGKTSPKHERLYTRNHKVYSRHAEMHLLDLLPDISHARRMKMYVIRVKDNGSIGMSKPCKWCQEKLCAAGVKPRNIYYVNWHNQWVQLDDWNFDQFKEPYVLHAKHHRPDEAACR